MLLCIDTSSKACSVALADGQRLLSECYLNTGLTHSTTLLRLVDNCLSQASVDAAELTAVAVSVGPGSYTGLRIGVSAAKGLAFARNLDCYGVSTLAGLAHNVSCFEGTVLAVLDARVGQVFCALFDVGDGVVRRKTPDGAMTLTELAAHLPPRFLAVGDGAGLIKQSMPEKTVLLPPEHLRLQRASALISAVAQGHPTTTAEKLVPAYHRKSQAEREREEKLL